MKYIILLLVSFKSVFALDLFTPVTIDDLQPNDSTFISVISVTDNNYAKSAGLKVGDKILAIDGFRVYCFEEYDFIREIETYKNRQKVTLLVTDGVLVRKIETKSSKASRKIGFNINSDIEIQYLNAFHLKFGGNHDLSLRSKIEIMSLYENSKDTSFVPVLLNNCIFLMKEEFENVTKISDNIENNYCKELALFYERVADNAKKGVFSPTEKNLGFSKKAISFFYPLPRPEPLELGDSKTIDEDILKVLKSIYEKKVHNKKGDREFLPYSKEEEYGCLVGSYIRFMFKALDEPVRNGGWPYRLSFGNQCNDKKCKCNSKGANKKMSMGHVAGQIAMLSSLEKEYNKSKDDFILFCTLPALQMLATKSKVDNNKRIEVYQKKWEDNMAVLSKNLPYLTFVAYRTTFYMSSFYNVEIPNESYLPNKIYKNGTPKIIDYISKRDKLNMYSKWTMCKNIARMVNKYYSINRENTLEFEINDIEKKSSEAYSTKTRKKLLDRWCNVACPFPTHEDFELLKKITKDNMGTGLTLVVLEKLFAKSYALNFTYGFNFDFWDFVFTPILHEIPNQTEIGYPFVHKTLAEDSFWENKETLLERCEKLYMDHGRIVATVHLSQELLKRNYEKESKMYLKKADSILDMMIQPNWKLWRFSTQWCGEMLGVYSGYKKAFPNFQKKMLKEHSRNKRALSQTSYAYFCRYAIAAGKNKDAKKYYSLISQKKEDTKLSNIYSYNGIVTDSIEDYKTWMRKSLGEMPPETTAPTITNEPKEEIKEEIEDF